MHYSYAKLSRYDLGLVRFLGTGLGNLLFPWARFAVATRKYGLTPISPTWFQVRVGTLLRKEADKRFYNGIFRTPSGQISGWTKLYLLSTLPRISEVEFLSAEKRRWREMLVVFQGSEAYFSSLLRDHELVKDELLKMTLDKHKRGLMYNFGLSISVHVRLGDFSVPQTSELIKEGRVNCRLPISWYVRVVNQIRSGLGAKLPVYVFSDGTDEELSELLALRSSQRLGFGSSIADLLALSRSHLLVASGSTFSMWASYLGRMPVIWHIGQLRQRLYYEKPEAEIECGERGEIPASFLAQVASP
ncbi:MAG: alpha-1,2-fucosyltransferase [Candidatus Binatia bacterium]